VRQSVAGRGRSASVDPGRIALRQPTILITEFYVSAGLENLAKILITLFTAQIFVTSLTVHLLIVRAERTFRA
jgi:hypothetical protein